MSQKPKVAFICVHNSCRSQIAEALGKYLASDVFESYSAGTQTVPQINQDAVRLMKQLYGIDMEQTQYSKLLTELPPIDIVVTMGCNVNCPYLPCKYRENWGLDDPSGKDEAEYRKTIAAIEQKMMALKEFVKENFEHYRVGEIFSPPAAPASIASFRIIFIFSSSSSVAGRFAMPMAAILKLLWPTYIFTFAVRDCLSAHSSHRL